MAKIVQCRLSKSMKKFSFFMDKYKMGKYRDPNASAVFFGMYDPADEVKLSQHNPNSLAVIIWMGSDIFRERWIDEALSIEKRLGVIKNMKNVRHIAISSFMAADFKKYNIPYKFLPISGSDLSSFHPVVLGKEIYTYIPPTHYRFYGGHIVDKLRKKCKYKINIADGCYYYNRKDLIRVYERCFCGLRFTPHDGIAHTTVEMGFMGMGSFYNGEVPGAIKWDKNDISGILDNINKEAKKIGTVNKDLAEEWNRFMDIGEDWLNEEYWK